MDSYTPRHIARKSSAINLGGTWVKSALIDENRIIARDVSPAHSAEQLLRRYDQVS